MQINELEIPGVYLVDNFVHEDKRGLFVKTFNKNIFLSHNIQLDEFREIYYSISHQNTIRGMHFQAPPSAHAKLVYLAKGSVSDVILDLRIQSPFYGKFHEVELMAHRNALYIPIGIAHGFKVHEDNTIMVYNQTTEYVAENDKGIHYASFNYNWNISKPIISERDRSFIKFDDFKSPF